MKIYLQARCAQQTGKTPKSSGTLERIRVQHGEAYSCNSPTDITTVLNGAESRGYLIRTRIWSAI